MLAPRGFMALIFQNKNIQINLPGDHALLSSWNPMMMPSLVCKDSLLSCREHIWSLQNAA